MARPVDYAWEALVTATNANVTDERGALNKALAQIRAQVPQDVDSDELGRVITHRANQYRELWPTMSLTATALAKHWARLPVEHGRLNMSKATNRSVPASGCETCGGDRFVAVDIPAPKVENGDGGYTEAYMRCPKCNYAPTT